MVAGSSWGQGEAGSFVPGCRPVSLPVIDPSQRTDRRPRPSINQDSAYFWEGTAVGEVRIQRCAVCQRLRHAPMPACPVCRSFEWDWIVASGRGTVHSWVVQHHPAAPGFEGPVPIVLVDLEEGVRMVGDLVGDANALGIGLSVEAVLVRLDDDITLVSWRAVTGAVAQEPA